MNLKEIQAPIKNEMDEFKQRLKSSISSSNKIIDTVVNYILKRKGKQIRPVFVFLTAGLNGKINDATYRAAILIEILHTATLIHDDVVDDANKRRGFPSINRMWKNKVAVLMGDFIFSKTLINMIGLKDFSALELIASTAEKLASGEILQIEKTLTKSMNEETYFDMIYKKTASLISTSCELGAITSTGKTKDRKAMLSYGTKLGMAFQIKDDLFDILGNENQMGKDMGADIKRNMVTLPLIHAFKKVTKVESNRLKKILASKKKTNFDLNNIKEIVDRVGGFNYAKEKIVEFNEQALDAISPYPNSPYKQSMVDLIAFNSHRTG